MSTHLWRRPLVAAASVSLLAAGFAAAAPTASAVSCRPTPALLSRTPTVVKLAGSATARIWDTGATPSNPQASTRIVAVTVPAAAPGGPRVRGSGNLTTSHTPWTYMAATPKAVVMVNGAVFDPVRGALTTLPQMTGGVVTKARSTHDAAMVIARDGTLELARLWLTGLATASGRGWGTVTGLNWQTVTGGGVNVYTPSWGPQRRPYGTVDVVLVGGRVAAVRTGTARGAPPAAGQTILTAVGSVGTWLSTFPRGNAVSVTYRPLSDAEKPVSEAVGRGTQYLDEGVKYSGTCSARDELLRPRTVVGWTRSGTMIVLTVSGRAVIGGVRYGGATVHQMADYITTLAAYEATALDGGGSTTMLARTPTGAIIRLDRGMTEAQRPVPNVFYID